MQQIENGLARFIDNELAPKIPMDGQNGQAKRLGILVAMTYMIHKQMPAMLNTMGAVDNGGNVDIEGIMEVLRARVPESGLRVQMPMFGELVFYPVDIDQMRSYIMGG
jgi:hypothetical protein